MKNNDIIINMEKEIFKGNVLDIGFDTYGIIYNIYKQYNDESAVDYIHGAEEKLYIEKEIYDSCVMFFSLSNFWTKYNKKNIFKDIYSFLKDNGEINIWDINKGYAKIFSSKIKILLPDNILKEIRITDYNFLKDNSTKSIVKLLSEYFDIIDIKTSNNIYYIRGIKRKQQDIKKGYKTNESYISRSKFKIHTQ